ncbi:hypothetical protein [Prosthecobacter sp.]|uniref:hypothetical protein n=1 Tax=Prosthecobacter sp. TaxID=1965333 RepID=UPI00378322E4
MAPAFILAMLSQVESRSFLSIRRSMDAMTMLRLKQQLVRMGAKQRQEVSAFLHKLKQDTPAWKKEMTRRMAEMDSGKKFYLRG